METISQRRTNWWVSHFSLRQVSGIKNYFFRLEIQKVPLKGRGIFSTRSFHKVSSVIFDILPFWSSDIFVFWHFRLLSFLKNDFRVNLWWSTPEILLLLKKQKSETKNIQRTPINMEVTCIILFTGEPNGVSMLQSNQGNTDGF